MQVSTYMLKDAKMANDLGIDETKQRIIESATTLFGEVGYTRATTRAIAERAGVNEVTVFRHFRNKKNLLLICVRAGNQTGVAQTFQTVLTGSYAADIRAIGKLTVWDTQRRFEFLRLLLCDVMAVPDLQEMLMMGASDNRERVAAYFRQQIEMGIVRSDLDPHLLANAFDSLFSSYSLFARFAGVPPEHAAPNEETIESLASLFVQGTLANLRE
jgi:AcrR family transcriptional regulator